MANRFWVGGTATWDATAGSKWSLTSGGAGGVAVPTASDDVFFDALSTGTCTISTTRVAKTLNCTGFTGTLGNSTNSFTVSGNVTLGAGMTYSAGQLRINATATVITAGKTLTGGLQVSGTGITVTLGDALTAGQFFAGQALEIIGGTFDTANFNVTTSAIRAFGSTTRVVTFGSSNITVTGTGGCDFSGTNITVNAGTSTINGTVTYTFNGGGKTFHNVSNTANSAGNFTVLGANTFNDLTISATSTTGKTLLLGANQTVNGTFICASPSVSARIFVFSDTIGTARTVTAAAVSATDCDFRDITIAGGAAPISPTRAGDCEGNSGITFPAAKTCFRVGTNTSWAGSSSWALTSGGAGSDNNFPLPQDTVVIDEATTLTTTLFIARNNIGTFDTSTRTTGITLNHNSTTNRYGSYTFGSGVTISGSGAQTFSGRGTMVFTSAGKTMTFPIVVDTPGGTFQLGDAYSASNTITHTRGTFDANNFNLTSTTFASSNSNVRTITMGSGQWTLSGTGTVWDTTTTTNLTFNKDTANILLSDTSSTARTFNGGGLSYNKLTIGGATGTSVLTMSGANSFTELASTKTVAHTVRLSADQGTIDTWSITGSSGNVVTFDSSVAATRRTFNLTNVTSGINFLDVKDIGVNQTNRYFVGVNSTDSGNNLNVIFTAAPGSGTGNFFMLFT